METREKSYGVDYVDKIEPEQALEILTGWASAGARHGLLFQCKNTGFISAIITLQKIRPEFILCGPKPSTYMFKLLNARFGLGPFARMEYPEKKDSEVTGVHIYLESGSFLFIANQAKLPSSPMLENNVS